MRIAKSLFFVLSLFPAGAWSAVSYSDTLDAYRKNVTNLVETESQSVLATADQLSPAEKAEVAAALRSFLDAAERRLDYFVAAYEDVYLHANPDSPYRASIGTEEAWVIRGLDGGLEKIHALLQAIRARQRPLEFQPNLTALLSLSARLAVPGTTISDSAGKSLDLVFPSWRAKLFVILTYLREAFVKGHSLFSTLSQVRQEHFLRPAAEVVMEGWNPALADTSKAVYILVFNHDYGVFDVANIQRVAARMGVPEPGLLTVMQSWPHYFLRPRTEENIVFISDEKPVDRLRDFALRHAGQGAVVAIAPEGHLPHFYAQFPMATKPGAFVLARKIAVALGEQMPVHLVPVFANALEHLTSPLPVPMRVHVDEPIAVPTDPLTARDAWVGEMRLHLENRANANRGMYLVDLSADERIPGMALPAARPVSKPLLELQALSPFAPNCREFLE